MQLGTNNFQAWITPISKFISVLLNLQGSRATPKQRPIEKIVGTDFFLHNWNRFEGCHNSVSGFYFYCAALIYMYILIIYYQYTYVCVLYETTRIDE